MQIQINADRSIVRSENLTATAEGYIEDAVRHFRDQITRVEVHLKDENSQKSGPNDKRCMMEARITGHPPLAVADEGESMVVAMAGAAEKLKSALGHLLGRLDRH